MELKRNMLQAKKRAKQIFNFLNDQYRLIRTDAFIISFPKSGRTWLRVLIGKALCETFGLSNENMLDTYRITSEAGILRSRFTHDRSSHGFSYLFSNLPTDKSRYRNKKVIFLSRNIKDVVVSCYFQATKRIGKYDGSISDYIRSERFGARKIIAFYNIWHENRGVPKDFLLVRYEDLHKMPKKILLDVLKFLGLSEIEDRVLKEAIEFASFDNMKKMERNGVFDSLVMRPGKENDEESYKVRRGLVEGYSSYLSEEDVKYIDEKIIEMGCAFEEGNTNRKG